MTQDPRSKEAFQRAGRARRQNIVQEFLGFIKHYKKWWLIPVLLVFLLLGFLVVVGGTGAAPFIYTLF